MKRTALLALLAVTACVDNRSSIEIGGPLAPDGVPSCKFSPSNLSPLMAGVLDVGASALPTYVVVVKVTNNLTDPAAVSSEGFSPAKDWTADAARVRVNPKEYLDRYAPNPTLLAFQADNVTPLTGQTVTKAGGSAALAVVAVSGALGAQLATAVAAGDARQVVLGISLQGHTADGAYLETSDWYYPITVCRGCLAAPACAAGQVLVPQSCFGAGQDLPPVCSAATGG